MVIFGIPVQIENCWTGYGRLAPQLAGYVPDLIRLVLDADAHGRDSDDPVVWAPLHAPGARRPAGAPVQSVWPRATAPVPQGLLRQRHCTR